MEAASPNRLSRREWLLVLALAVASFILRCAVATRRGFWIDEFYTYHATTFDVQGLIAERLSAGHSPLPFLYAKIFHTLFGDSELGLKLSSILAGFMATFAVAGAAASMGLKRILPVLLPVLFLHPYWHLIATEFRYMMPLVAMGAFWLWFAIDYMREPTRRRFHAVMIFGAITLWIHNSAIFTFVGIVVIYTWHAIAERIRGRQLLRLFAPLIAAFTIMLPLTVGLGIIEKEPGSPKTPDIFKAINKTAESLFADPSPAESWIHLKSGIIQVPATILFVVCAIAACLYFRRERNRIAMRVLFGMLAGTVLITMVYSGLKNNIQGPVRYVAFSSVPAAIIVAVGLLEVGRWKLWGWLIRILLCSILVFSFVLQLLDQGDWHRESVKWLIANRKSNQPIIAVGRSMNLLAFRYYGMETTGWIDGLSAEVRGKPIFRKMMRRALANGDMVYFFHYRGQRRYDEVAESIDTLLKNGEVVRTRIWEPSAEIRITGMAKNEEGVRQLEALPAIPVPRFGSTHR
ncbi:hypothetical protein IT570_12635 [Candidatus Sumerlaeota bacterium]|nr:hypothetical protein [Candidatus Sumerlaeota bacterium]